MRPVRVALFAPGSKERVMAKAIESGADAVLFDLEDSVASAAKAEARTLVARAIDGAAAIGAERVPALFVRVNAAASGLLDDDLAAIVRPGLEAIFLPKVESVAEVAHTASTLEHLESEKGMKRGTVELVLMIESALGVYRCFDLVNASPRVASTCIGVARDGDLQTDLGCGWSIEGMELLYARSKVLLDTRAAGKAWPLDGVFSDLNDEAGLVKDSQLSARLGYVGRTVIHPKQIAPVRAAYAVPEADVAYYQTVVKEFEAVEKTGTAAAITVEGKLVDYAMYQRAKRVLELAKLDR
ncbi:MAG TPA: CoA ester lyase [Burkholderiales bacterium]|jgi:citrate lyase subunit beta/citryl-CoA lyase|nr:CoA ester lyase [Burkholderiales bacterium]